MFFLSFQVTFDPYSLEFLYYLDILYSYLIIIYIAIYIAKNLEKKFLNFDYFQSKFQCVRTSERTGSTQDQYAELVNIEMLIDFNGTRQNNVV